MYIYASLHGLDAVANAGDVGEKAYSSRSRLKVYVRK